MKVYVVLKNLEPIRVFPRKGEAHAFAEGYGHPDLEVRAFTDDWMKT